MFFRFFYFGGNYGAFGPGEASWQKGNCLVK